MKRALANVIVWGLFGTVATILMVGCATRQPAQPLPPGMARVSPALVQVVKANERLTQREEIDLRMDVEGTVLRVDDDGRVDCVDVRWGKCEQHGEWLLPVGLAWGFLNKKAVASDPQLLARHGPVSTFLLCPRWHCIEREIEASQGRQQ